MSSKLSSLLQYKTSWGYLYLKYYMTILLHQKQSCLEQKSSWPRKISARLIPVDAQTKIES